LNTEFKGEAGEQCGTGRRYKLKEVELASVTKKRGQMEDLRVSSKTGTNFQALQGTRKFSAFALGDGRDVILTKGRKKIT